MSLDTSRWRSSPMYDYIDYLTAPDVGWECLRRNDHYQDDYTEFNRSAGNLQRLVEGVRQRWGLRFPGASDP